MPAKQSSGKKGERAAREQKRNAAERVGKVARARARHMKNALQSCGPAFVLKMRLYYADRNPAPKKAG